MHKNLKKSLILQNMHLLLLEAHKSRIKTGTDFFEKNDKKAMNVFLSNYYVRRGENSFWEGNFMKSMSKLAIALRANPSNKMAYKTLFFIIRKSILRI